MNTSNVYKYTCTKCKQEKLFCDMKTVRGVATSWCRECARKKTDDYNKKSKKFLHR